jgi:hypothetical protein
MHYDFWHFRKYIGVIKHMKHIKFSRIGWQDLIFAVVVVIAPALARAQGTPRELYPNELANLKFYDQYLSPLRPYISERAAVLQTLGSDQGKEFPGWRVLVSFVGDYKSNTLNGRPWVQDISGRLARLDLVPKKRVSMRRVKFPPTFMHSYGEVSEINVTCDVYSDDSGLEYWIYSENSKVGKKGDLMRIVYGPNERIKGEIEGLP